MKARLDTQKTATQVQRANCAASGGKIGNAGVILGVRLSVYSYRRRVELSKEAYVLRRAENVTLYRSVQTKV